MTGVLSHNNIYRCGVKKTKRILLSSVSALRSRAPSNIIELQYTTQVVRCDRFPSTGQKTKSHESFVIETEPGSSDRRLGPSTKTSIRTLPDRSAHLEPRSRTPGMRSPPVLCNVRGDQSQQDAHQVLEIKVEEVANRRASDDRRVL